MKAEEDFYFRDRARTVRQSYCKACKSDYNRRWYRAHRSAQLAAVSRNSRAHRRAVRAYVRARKSAPCADCGRCFDAQVMDFDHVRGEKVDNVSALVARGARLARIIEEIEKCDLVCANCHRMRTLRRHERHVDRTTAAHDGQASLF